MPRLLKLVSVASRRKIGGRLLTVGSGVSKRGPRRSTETRFIDSYWETAIDESYSKMQDNPSLNPGQETILSDYKEEIINYLMENGADYDPNDFLSFLEEILGENKYAALSETFEIFAEDDLSDAWDHATGGDGIGGKKFMGVEYD